MPKLLLIDGSNLLFQMFCGMPSRIINKDGKAIHCTLGFVGGLLKIIRMTQPTHIAVLFDGEHENARCLIDENYKANRPVFSDVPWEENPYSQLEDVYAALDFMRLRHTEIDECEADDVIAAYTIKYGEQLEAVISSQDSDFFQLINKNVTVLRYRGKNTVLCDEAYIIGRLGIFPGQYAEFKALTGDSSDNIKGIRGVGPKTAAKLLAQFGSISELIQNTDKIERAYIKTAVQSGIERLIRGYSLIKLDGSAQMPFSLSELEYSDSGIKTTEVLHGIGLK